MKTIQAFQLCLTLAASTSMAHAGLSQSAIASPGGFVQTGAYLVTSGGSFVPGADMSASFGTGPDLEEHAFSSLGPVSADSTASATNVSNSVAATSGMGFFRASASDSFPCNQLFSIAAGNGGWKETFTVSHPSFNGQAGFLVFQIRVRGSLAAAGFNGSAAVSTTGYMNNAELAMNSLFNRGNSDAIGTDRQRAQWGASSAPDVTRNIDGVVTMAAPITFGQSFTLGVYAFVRASQRSSASVQCMSTSSADFSANGVTWNGIVSVQANGTPINGYTITHASTFDWNRPFGACVADVDDGTGTGTPDGGVTIDDLLYYLGTFEQGAPAADVDDGSGTGTPDGGVTIDDLLYYLLRFENGC